MWRLIIEDDLGQKVEVPFLRDEITIGRKEGNTIRLLERNISRYHASLVRVGEKVAIEDVDSYNGVVLNGNRIVRKTNIYPGDLVEIGDYRIFLVRDETGIKAPVELDTEDAARRAHERENDSAPRLPVVSASESAPGPRPKTYSPTPRDTKDALHNSKTLIFEVPDFSELATEDQERPAREADSYANETTLRFSPITEEDPMTSDPEDTKDLNDAQPAHQEASPADTQSSSHIETPAAKRSSTKLPNVLNAKRAAQSVAYFAAKSEEELLLAKQERSKNLMLAGIITLVVVLGGYGVIRCQNERTEEKVASMLAQSAAERQKAIEAAKAAKEPNVALLGEDAKRALIEKSLKEARRSMDDKHWQEAEWTLTTLLKDLPDTKEAVALKEKARFERENQDHFNEAMRTFANNELPAGLKALKDIDPNSNIGPQAVQFLRENEARIAREVVGRMQTALRKGDKPLAYDLSMQILTFAPNNAEAKQVYQSLKSVLPKLDPKAAQERYLEAAALARKNKLEDAVALFEQALKLNPSHANAIRGRADCLAGMGKTAEAIKGYERYLEISPLSKDAGEVRQKMEKLRKGGK